MISFNFGSSRGGTRQGVFSKFKIKDTKYGYCFENNNEYIISDQQILALYFLKTFYCKNGELKGEGNVCVLEREI